MQDERTDCDLVDWSDTPLGRYLLEQELGLLGHRLARLPGSSMLWLGYPGTAFAGGYCGHRERTLVVPNADLARARLDNRFTAYVSAQPAALPFATASMQSVIVQHAFDFASDVHEAVRECARVLQMGGQIVVVGFNPFSAWGARRSVQRRWGAAPWCGRQVRQGRLIDWLQLLGFKVLEAGFGIPRLPLGSPDPAVARSARLRRAVPGGAVYLVHARKEGYGVNPLRIVRKAVPLRLVPATLGASAREQADDS